MTPLKQLAIKYALVNNWKEAANTNDEILKENPNDIDTLNRLGFALIKLEKYTKAKIIYKRVMTLDKTNPIATKNLKKLETISKGQKRKNNNDPKIFPDINNIEDLFIEESGKTKVIDLKNIADKKTLSYLQSGDFVNLIIKRSKIFVQTKEKKYIGMLPDSLTARLVAFMKGGNEYQSYLKGINDKNVTIFVKEIKRSTKYKNQPSFLPSSNLLRLSKNKE
ncbi:tetratricopeptide repeat protein [Candidatus Parcubacteria bacterium]|nr:MAG: tetratricopeptide repeat protein [Candidatus Parcubacteria bacterium]